MLDLTETLSKNHVVYVTRDLERALALRSETRYFIITNASDFAKRLAKEDQNIFVIDTEEQLDTRELLERPETKKLLDSLQNPAVLVFKNTVQIEKICKAAGWKLLNPPSTLASQIEEKISQIEWLGDLSLLLPPHEILLGKQLAWNDEPFVLQFNRAHTGSGTVLISSERELVEMRSKYPERPMRISTFIKGPVFTSNIVVADDIFPGPIMYQITGIAPFTTNPFATIGNDWELANKLLSAEQKNEYFKIAQKVGEKMKESGWKGLFGIDVILNEATGNLHLLEINARQPASTSFESELQDHGNTTFRTHLAALLEVKGEQISEVKNGAQIILRSPFEGTFDIEKISNDLKNAGLNILSYTTSEPGKDLLRIQSKKGIMDAHNVLNEQGLTIKKIIEKYG